MTEYSRLSRRSVLCGGIAILAGSLSLGGCWERSLPPGFAPVYFSWRECQVFELVSDHIVPGGDGAPPASALEVVRGADQLLSRLNASVQADFHLLLFLFERAPLLAGNLLPFTSQRPQEADRYLERWQHGRLPLLRQGFAGIRRLAAAVYYADPRSWPAIGYLGPWIGRHDVGYGLNNQGDLPLVNPHVFAKFRQE